MNPFEIVGYVAMGFVPTLVAMKIGWDMATKKMLFSYVQKEEKYSISEPTSLTAKI